MSAVVRDMENYYNQMICQLLLGNFSIIPMVTLTEKKIKLSIAHWLPLQDKLSERTQKEHKRGEDQAACQMDGDNVQVDLTPPEHITGMGQLLSIQLCWIY